jgi:hypothetical protein
MGRRNCQRLSCFPFFPALPENVAREAFRASYRVYGPVTALQLCLRVPTGAVDALLQDRRCRLSTASLPSPRAIRSRPTEVLKPATKVVVWLIASCDSL